MGRKPVSASDYKNAGPSTEPAPHVLQQPLSECFAFSVLPNDPLLVAAETKTSVKGMRHTFTLGCFAKIFPF